jgi:hypothetical protein
MKEKLIEFLELEKAVIPEPWVATKFGDEIGVYQGPIKKQRGSLSYKATICILEDPDISDLPTVRLRQLAEFIAQSRTIAPLAVRELLEAVEILEEQSKQLEDCKKALMAYGWGSEKAGSWMHDLQVLINKTKQFTEDFDND